MKRRNAERWRAIEARLGREMTIWLSTVRGNGRPHVVLEGEAHAADRATTDTLAEYFYHKYEWAFRYDEAEEWRLVEITPDKILAWGDGYDEEGHRLL